MTGLYQMATLTLLCYFRDSLYLIEEGNVKLAKLIVNSVALANYLYLSTNTGKRYSYSNRYKNKASVSFALTLFETDFTPFSRPIHHHKCKHSTFPKNFNHPLCETHGSTYVSSASKPVNNKTVCKLVRIWSCSEPVIFSSVYKSLHASNISIGETVCCSISCKSVSDLIGSEPVKSFFTCKPVCFSKVSIAKDVNSVNYCSVACTEHAFSAVSPSKYVITLLPQWFPLCNFH